MKRVKVFNDPDKPGVTYVTLPDGTPVPGVTSITLKPIRGGQLVEAQLTLWVDLELIASPVFNETELKAIAASHGYKLVKAHGPQTPSR